jgi:predicted nucleotidyltransferase
MTVEVSTCQAHLQARQCRRDAAREMARQQLLQVVRTAVHSVLPAFPQVHRVYLFGSTARPGAMHQDSDVDLAVEGCLSAETYFALWRELEQAIPGRTVEVVELTPGLSFTERVHQTGEMIYERPDPHPEG